MSSTPAPGRGSLRAWWEDSPKRWSGPTLWSLAWLGIMFFPIVFDPDFHQLRTVGTVAVIAMFVPFYLAVELRPGPLRPVSPAITTVLAVLTVSFTSGGSVLMVYAAAFAGSHLPRRAGVRWLAGLTVLLGVLAALSPVPFPFRVMAFAPALVLIWVIGLASIEEAEYLREERSRTARAARVATLTERERIARDLHDLLGQTLTGIVVRSQLARKLTAVDAAAGIAEMAEVERAARAALTEMRTTVSGFRHIELDDELAAARSALDAAGVELTVNRAAVGDLAPTVETALGLALREGVTNVVRHARAHRCTVTLHRVDGEVVLEVVDDGVGGPAREGNGLTGMRERIGDLGGVVTRRTSPGSTLRVTVPAATATGTERDGSPTSTGAAPTDAAPTPDGMTPDGVPTGSTT